MSYVAEQDVEEDDEIITHHESDEPAVRLVSPSSAMLPEVSNRAPPGLRCKLMQGFAIVDILFSVILLICGLMNLLGATTQHNLGTGYGLWGSTLFIATATVALLTIRNYTYTFLNATCIMASVSAIVAAVMMTFHMINSVPNTQIFEYPYLLSIIDALVSFVILITSVILAALTRECCFKKGRYSKNEES